MERILKKMKLKVFRLVLKTIKKTALVAKIPVEPMIQANIPKKRTLRTRKILNKKKNILFNTIGLKMQWLLT